MTRVREYFSNYNEEDIRFRFRYSKANVGCHSKIVPKSFKK